MKPSNDLRVSIVQGETRWHDPEANREYYGDVMRSLRGITDVVVLPETFTSGFSNDAMDRAEDMDGPTVAWVREQAQLLDAAVTGSVQLRAGDGVFNRIDDADGFDAEAAQGRLYGFDGKSLIHPSQIEPANRAFSL